MAEVHSVNVVIGDSCPNAVRATVLSDGRLCTDRVKVGAM